MKIKRSTISIIICFLPFLLIPSVQAKSQDTQEKLINDAFLTSLDPYMQKAVNAHYQGFKQFGLYDAKVLNIQRESEGGFSFVVKVQVRTFEHAQNPPYGIDAITMNVSPFGVKVINFDHKGDEWETKIARFKREVIDDIQGTFNLDLKTYQQYDLYALRYLSESDKRFSPLVLLSEAIQKNELSPDKKPPYINVIDPIAFIKDHKGYILVKKADGTNILYSIIETGGVWKIAHKQSAQGKQMPKELLWYMKHKICP